MVFCKLEKPKSFLFLLLSVRYTGPNIFFLSVNERTQTSSHSLLVDSEISKPKTPRETRNPVKLLLPCVSLSHPHLAAAPSALVRGSFAVLQFSPSPLCALLWLYCVVVVAAWLLLAPGRWSSVSARRRRSFSTCRSSACVVLVFLSFSSRSLLGCRCFALFLLSPLAGCCCCRSQPLPLMCLPCS